MSNINKKDSSLLLLLELLSAAIYGKPVTALSSTEDYARVYKELQEQALLPMTAGVYKKLPLTEELREDWDVAVAYGLSQLVNLQQTEKNLVSLLEKADIACVIIKGSAAAVYYPPTVFRTFGDIDVLVLPEQYEYAAELMEKNGYARQDGLYDDPRNVTFYRGRQVIELHRCFFNNPAKDRKIYEAFPKRSHRLAYRIETPVLPDEINGLILLEHMRQHMRDGFGFRQLIDWLMFVNAVCDEIFWKEQFRTLAEENGLVPLAKIATRAAERCFGTEKERAWAADSDPELVDCLVRHIRASGNFGRNRSASDNSLFYVATKKYSIRGWLKYLQKAGLSHWPTARECPFLRPFAWLYQLGRYAVLGIRTGRLRGFVSEGHYDEAKQAKKLFTAVGA